MAIRHKRKGTAGYTWLTTDLAEGQIGLNIEDGTLHFKKNDDSIVSISEGGSGIADVVEDTTPQLGGDLDLNGNGFVNGSETALTFSVSPGDTNYLQLVTGNATTDLTSAPGFYHAGTGNGSIQFRPSTIDDYCYFHGNLALHGSGGIYSSDETQLISFNAAGSAVNHVEIASAITSQNPSIVAAGDDTDIDLSLGGKGAGVVSTQGSLSVANAATIGGNIVLGSSGKIIAGRSTDVDVQTDIRIYNEAGDGRLKMRNTNSAYDTVIQHYLSTNAVASEYRVDEAGNSITISNPLGYDFVINGFTLSNTDGTNGQVLTTDGSGNLGWATVGTGGLGNVVEDTTPQLGGTLDANGNDIDMGTNTITDTKVGQWDTAYGWGDHGTEGYLTSVTASDIDSTGATDGYVLTADGAGNTAWEVVSGGSSNNWLTANNGSDFGVAPSATGSNSIALGYQADAGSTENVICIGYGAANTANKDNNIIIGTAAKSYAASGVFGTGQVIIGGNAESRNNYGVAIGYNADNSSKNGIAFGYFANTGNADNSVAIGPSARTYGQQSVALGHQAGAWNQAGSQTGYDNTTCLGTGTAVSAANQVQLGSSITTTYAYGAVQDRSDSRDKTDIADTTLGLEFINALTPREFVWDYREDYFDQSTDENGEPILVPVTKDGSRKRTRKHQGVIAQEVKAVMDAMGVDFGGYQDHSINGGEDVKSIGYQEFIAPLIKAVQELSAKCDDLQAQVDALSS